MSMEDKDVRMDALPNEILHVTVQRLNPDTRELVATPVDEDFAGLTMFADNVDRKSFQEIILLDDSFNIARKLVCSQETSKLLPIALMMAHEKSEQRQKASEAVEDLLASMFNNEVGGDKPC